jgi:hypothetical protein
LSLVLSPQLPQSPAESDAYVSCDDGARTLATPSSIRRRLPFSVRGEQFASPASFVMSPTAKGVDMAVPPCPSIPLLDDPATSEEDSSPSAFVCSLHRSRVHPCIGKTCTDPSLALALTPCVWDAQVVKVATCRCHVSPLEEIQYDTLVSAAK